MLRNPVSYTGIVRHTLWWITSPTDTIIYPNPLFIPSETEDTIGIYCIHGTADYPQAFSLITERLLEKKLPANVDSIILCGFSGRGEGNSIEYFAIQLVNKILAAKHKRVILLGHSRGGLIAAYAAEYIAASWGIKVESIISMGTPFNGSELVIAPLSKLSTSVSQMEPNNDFLKSLVNKIISSTVSYYFVVASDDKIVGSHSSSIPAYVEKNPASLIKLSTPHGHLSMLSSHELVAKILSITFSYFTKKEPVVEQSPEQEFIPIW